MKPLLLALTAAILITTAPPTFAEEQDNPVHPCIAEPPPSADPLPDVPHVCMPPFAEKPVSPLLP